MDQRTFLGGTVATPLAAQAQTTANETIRRAWQAGLDVLKPNPKDLERGLELHRNALVFDSYGFAPRAAPDGDAGWAPRASS